LRRRRRRRPYPRSSRATPGAGQAGSCRMGFAGHSVSGLRPRKANGRLDACRGSQGRAGRRIRWPGVVWSSGCRPGSRGCIPAHWRSRPASWRKSSGGLCSGHGSGGLEWKLAWLVAGGRWRELGDRLELPAHYCACNAILILFKRRNTRRSAQRGSTRKRQQNSGRFETYLTSLWMDVFREGMRAAGASGRGIALAHLRPPVEREGKRPQRKRVSRPTALARRLST
jgi:hypothetical protein